MIATTLRFFIALAVAVAIGFAWLLSRWLGGLGALTWPIALVAGIALTVGAHSALLGFEFLLTSWLNDGAKAAPTAEHIDCGPRWRAWLAEIPVALRAFGWAMPFFGARTLPSGNDPAKLPVLLVHGYFCNRAMFLPLARDLAAAGHAVDAVNLEPPLTSIDLFPALIESAVQELLATSGATRVALVGHSMGGLAIRAWLRDYGDARMVAVITLGTPHDGTLLARVGYTPIVRQMQPGSVWLNALAAQETLARTSRFTVIASKHDNIVVPQLPQSLPGAHEIVFGGLGHLDLACQPRARARIVSRLAEAAFSAPSKRDVSVQHAPNPRPDRCRFPGSPEPASPRTPG